MGGVISGLGKGITTGSIAKILQSRGYSVTAVKIDAYVNVDAGTMNPGEHGEVFVTKDGMETDQDIGNYERFIGTDIPAINYMTTGLVYKSVIERERNLEFGGKCVEVVPHVPLEVIRRIKKAAENSKADVTIIEIGGTAGEYQNILFLEAARMMKIDSQKDVAFVLVSYLPVPNHLGEMKTKPTQYATRTLNATGIQPDFIIARSHQRLDLPRMERLALLCNIRPEDIISNPDVDSIYEIPLLFEEQGLSEKILKKLDLNLEKQDITEWKKLVHTIKTVSKPIRIGMVGKYFMTGDFMLSDVYISVIEALKHAGWNNDVKLEMTWIDSLEFEKDPDSIKSLSKFDGIVVPGGFGSRGVEGIINAIRYSRENKIPYLGLCYGMQLAVVEFARNVAMLNKAHTTEIDKSTDTPVVHIMSDQEKKLLENNYGGTMRLGNWKCQLKKNTQAYEAYFPNGSEEGVIEERHRHRYEINNKYRDILENKGIVFSGLSIDGNLIEIAELPKTDHPFFLASQFHPEFTSRPLKPNPLFNAFIKACNKD